MLLSGNEIRNQIELGNIVIDPFDPDNLNSNSYNISLTDMLKIYDLDKIEDGVLDMRRDNPTLTLQIPETGFVLRPGMLYLGQTKERTWSDKFVPALDGRSSPARLSVAIHQTAGFGDAGFDGVWTLEISVIHPVRIYPFDKIGQVYFEPLFGLPPTLYRGKYQGQTEAVPSRSWQDYEARK